jgi:hypothetical protein
MEFKIDFNPFKDLPVRAIPVVVFLAGSVGFGELFIRLPTRTLLQEALAFAIGLLCLISGVLFLVKVLSDWPRTPGLHLD